MRVGAGAVRLEGRGRRAFTIPEMLVVVFLLLVTFLMLAQVLVPTLYLFRVQSARSDVQQGPLILVHYVQRNLLNAPVESIAFTDSPVALSWLEVDEIMPYDAATGSPRWSPWFNILYLDKVDHRILVKRWPPNPPTTLSGTYDFAAAKEPPMLREQDLRTICETPNGTERVLVKDVKTLKITDAADSPRSRGTIVFPVRVSIICEQEAATAKPGQPRLENFGLDVQVRPRSTRW